MKIPSGQFEDRSLLSIMDRPPPGKMVELKPWYQTSEEQDGQGEGCKAFD